jgi:hypothetical protein
VILCHYVFFEGSASERTDPSRGSRDQVTAGLLQHARVPSESNDIALVFRDNVDQSREVVVDVRLCV